MSDFVIETEGLTKRYGEFTAVDGIDFTVARGDVFGVLGPNGAGKTTTILMLLGLTEPTAGRVRVLGLDPVRQPLSVKARVGYMPERVGFYDELTARENLIYIAKLNGLPRNEANRRIEEALMQMGLVEAIDKQVDAFSRGMRQRLGVAEVLIKQPDLVIMDEPTQGLDPDGAREFLKIILRLKEEGITILLSSHLLFQVQSVCDRVALFHNGRMVLHGTVKELAQRVLGGAYRVEVEVEEATAGQEDALAALDGALGVHRPSARLFEIEATRDLRADAARAVIDAGGKLLSLDLEEPSLDEIYSQYFEEVEHDAAA